MKKLLSLILTIFVLISCDDGEIIVTDFNFDNPQLQWCGDTQSHVLYKINNSGVNEAIAFRFDMEIENPPFFTTEEGRLTIPLNATNRIIYRVFDSEVQNNYFCNEVPPVAPRVTEEFISTTGGEVIITSTLNTATDHDGDGVPSENEGMAGALDTDGDGIPNYLDIDDDGDNILTRVETQVEAANTVGNFPDSDNDGIANYLDSDDDGDGIPSRNEDWNQNLNPADDRNNENIPHYLNPQITDSFEVTGFRENSISRSFRYLVAIENLTLVNQKGDGEQIRLQDFELGYFDSPSQNQVIEPSNTGEEE